MNAVRAADAERVGELPRPGDQRVAVSPRPADDDLAGVSELQGERRVEDVRGGQPVVEPAPQLADRRRDDVDECRDVVTGGPLALLDRLDREGGSLPARSRGLFRDDAFRGPGLGRRELDLEPGLHAPLRRPDRADLLACVAGDHVLSLTTSSLSLDRALGVDDPSRQDPGVLGAVDRDAGDRYARRHLHR